MNKEDYTALLLLMETGIVKEVKHDKAREMILPAGVYAACNFEKHIPPEVLPRFQFKLHFRPYTEEEFIEVSRHVLIMRERLEERLASYIAREVAKISKDVRDALVPNGLKVLFGLEVLIGCSGVFFNRLPNVS